MNRTAVPTALVQKEARFSEVRALQLCRDVETLEASSIPCVAKLGEDLHDLAEVLVYNDKYNEIIVDKILMERDLMSTLERLVTNAMLPLGVKVHVLQCVTVLLQNLTRVSSVYFMCSNNRINRMIAIPIDEDDDELLSMYVSFLKSLALRLNRDTVQFFFEADLGAFPLFDKAAKTMAMTSDPMVRAATRQIVVCIVQIDDPVVQCFLYRALGEVYEGVLNAIVNQLVETARLVPSLTPGAPFRVSTLNTRATVILMEDVMDEVLYINDLYNSSPAATDVGRLREMLDRIVLEPVKALLEAELAGMHVDPKLHALTMCTIPPPVVVGLLARWAHENQVAAIAEGFRCCFLDPLTSVGSGGSANSDRERNGGSGSVAESIDNPSLMNRLLVGAPLLQPGVLLLRRALLEGLAGDSKVTTNALETTPSGEAAALSTFEKMIAMLTSEANARVALAGTSSLASLLTALDAHLGGRTVHGTGGAVALCAVAALLQQIREELTPAGRALFAATLRRLRAERLRQLVEVLRPRCEPDLSTAETSHCIKDSRVTPTDGWVRRHRFLSGLGFRDAYLTEFLELRRAWCPSSPAIGLPAILAGYDQKGVAPVLPLLPARSELVAYSAGWDHASRSAYDAFQAQVMETIPLCQRAAVTEEEKETVAHLMLHLLDHHATAHAGVTEGVKDTQAQRSGVGSASTAGNGPQGTTTVSDAQETPLGLPAVLRVLQAEHSPGDHFTPRRGAGAASVRLRCEFVSAKRATDAAQRRIAGTVSPGTCMHLALTTAEALFLAEPRRTCSEVGRQESAESSACLVLLAFDLLYARAALLPAAAPYRVVVQGFYPEEEVEVHLVFQDAQAAAQAVTQLNFGASQARLQGSRFLRDFISEGTA